MEKQSQLLVTLHGEHNSRICQNALLRSQFQMRCGLFTESLQSVKKAFELLEVTKAEIGNEYDVVKSKFHNLEASVNFVIGNYKACMDAATEGLKHVAAVKSSDLQVTRIVSNTKRDLINTQVRS